MPLDIDLNQPPHFDEYEDGVDLNQPTCFDEDRVEAEDRVEGGDDLNQSAPLSYEPEDEPEVLTSETSRKTRRFLTDEDRKVIWQLMERSIDNGILKNGTIEHLASLYNVHTSVIYRIWKQAKETGDPCHKKTRNCGRKRVLADIIHKIREVPLSKRTTLRSFANALGTNKSALIRLKKAGVIRRHSSALHPLLKDDNMIARLRYCLSMLDGNSISHNPRFKSFHDVVFIDEKWFYITKKNTNYYLLVGEDEPQRTCKSKNFVTKVMFLAAVTRPRFDNERNVSFSGKIGIYPFVYEQPAKRSSVNRVAGTMEKKPIVSVTREVNKMYLIDKVLPAIKNSWPIEDVGETIFIQQDNARSHINQNDEDFRKAASEGEFDIQLICQPPNSPDLNILDLGFFNAIQALQQKHVMKSIDDIISMVERAFYEFSPIQSDKIFLTLQSCMVEIMKVKGSNRYKVPHMKKDSLYNQVGIQNQLECDPLLIEEVTQYIENVNAS